MTELNLLYVPAMHMGYGRMGVSIAKALRTQGVTVYNDLPIPENDPNMIALPAGFDQTERTTGRSNIACWLSVPSHGLGWWKGQTPTILTMWEAQRLPEGFREHLHEYDTVIVPSRQNQELFSEWHPNVKYVPLGVDPDVWHYQARLPADRYFRFLCAGSGPRKGTDLAVKAFKRLWGKHGSWGNGPTPVLQLKNPRAEDFFGERIEMISGRLSDAEEVELYAGAHCYLGPSRGEGFGLQPLQAIAQGCPTILTNAHGHAAFADLGWGLSTTNEKAAYFIYGDAGDWWAPDLDELCEAMKAVYDNYDAVVSAAADSSTKALAQFTWDQTATKFLDALGRDRLGPYVGPDEWHSVSQLRYPIRVRAPMTRHIGAYTYQFRPDETAFVLADVKRVLFESGELDPCCLQEHFPDHGGLTLEQVERSGTYRAENGSCPTCGRPLNEGDGWPS